MAVTYNIAKKLKSIGFNVPTEKYYNKNKKLVYHRDVGDSYEDYLDDWNSDMYINIISAPTIEEVQKWLRTKKIFISIIPNVNNKFEAVIVNNRKLITLDKTYTSWDSALLDAIIKVL